MKIYIATAFPNIDHAKFIGERISKGGHEITSSWLNQTQDERLDWGDPGFEVSWARWSQRDVKEVKNSDLLIVWTDNHEKSKGGFSVETGVALGNDIPVWVVPKRTNSFHFAYGVFLIETWNELYSLLELYRYLDLAPVSEHIYRLGVPKVLEYEHVTDPLERVGEVVCSASVWIERSINMLDTGE